MVARDFGTDTNPRGKPLCPPPPPPAPTPGPDRGNNSARLTFSPSAGLALRRAGCRGCQRRSPHPAPPPPPAARVLCERGERTGGERRPREHFAVSSVQSHFRPPPAKLGRAGGRGAGRAQGQAPGPAGRGTARPGWVTSPAAPRGGTQRPRVRRGGVRWPRGRGQGRRGAGALTS